MKQKIQKEITLPVAFAPALAVLVLLLLCTAAYASDNRSLTKPTQLQSTAQYTRMEEVRAIYKDKDIDGYLVFLANTPSVVVVKRSTVFESAFGSIVSYESFDKMAKGRLVKVEANRDEEGRLIVVKLSIVEKNAEAIRILEDSRKTTVTGSKDALPVRGRGVPNGR